MPNHVAQLLTITGDKDVLDTIHDKHLVTDRRGKVFLDFQTIIPMPEELKDTTSPTREPNPELIEKYGHDNWYTWSLDNWDTKWNSYDGEVREHDENKLVLYLETAWSPAESVYAKLTEMYPVKIKMDCIDEGWCYAGTMEFEGGKTTLEDIDEDINEEKARKFEHIRTFLYDEEE